MNMKENSRFQTFLSVSSERVAMNVDAGNRTGPTGRNAKGDRVELFFSCLYIHSVSPGTKRDTKWHPSRTTMNLETI
jgi:hypothetical protein